MSDTHLVGTLDLGSRSTPLPEVNEFHTPPWALGEIDVVHVNHEISATGIRSTIPRAVNPSIPPHLSWLIYRVADSEFGPFSLAQTRVGCRVGLKPRALLVSAVCDNAEVRSQLRTRWGFDIRLGEVALQRRTDKVSVTVNLDGGDPVLELEILEPALLAGAGVPIAAGLNPANTPAGVRLLQVDPEYVIAGADRGRPCLRSFDAAAWGDPGITPTWPISGSVLRAEVTLPPLRFLIDPNRPATEGTTQIGQSVQ